MKSGVKIVNKIAVKEKRRELRVGFYIIQQGLFSYIDTSLARILGYRTIEDLIGKSIWDIVHPDDRKLLKMEIPEKESHLMTNRRNIRVFRKDKTIAWVHVGGITTTYKGKPANIGNIIDMTPSKKVPDYFKHYLMTPQSIIDQIEDGVSDVDLYGNVTFSSKANRRIWGYDDKSLDIMDTIGINYRSHMDEATAEYVARAYNEVYKTGIPGKNVVYEIIRRDGTLQTIESSISLIRNDEGTIIGFRSVNRDITERQKTEKELAEYRIRLEAIFRSVKDAIITLDPELRVILANDEMEKICGRSVKDIAKAPFTECFNQCSKACYEVIKQTLEKKVTIKDYRIECGHIQHNQQLVSVTSSPLMDQKGGFTGVLLVIKDITLLRDLERELRERNKFQNIIGKSRKMQDLYRLLEDLANLETTVLITGESGTGKELVAKAIHYSGQRAFNPFITVNCSALTESLLESELFGHVKGAFTGAIRDKQGRFQAADTGTILLDEIGDISPLIQLKLLRVLQEKIFERVGEANPQKVDVRIIACTNKNLKEKVRKGEFREDLYYRLKVVEVSMPPLRDRLEDMPLLVDHFCRLFNERFQKKIEDVSNEVLNKFMSYSWPGNIRELEHVIEHAFVLCHGPIVTLEHLPSEVRDCDSSGRISRSKSFVKDKINAQSILKALKESGGNKAKAARLLGISRPTLYRKNK
jgi:two-component system, NtrC family, response regulator HydG